MSYFYQEPDPASLAHRRTPQTLTSLMYGYAICEGSRTPTQCQIQNNYSLSQSCNSVHNVLRPSAGNPFRTACSTQAPQVAIRSCVHPPTPRCSPSAATTQVAIRSSVNPQQSGRFSSWTNRHLQRSNSAVVTRKENIPPKRKPLTIPQSSNSNTKQRTIDTLDLCNYFQENSSLTDVSPENQSAPKSAADLQKESLEFLRNMKEEACFPQVPSLPLFQIKKFLVKPTHVVERIFDEQDGVSLKKCMIFECDFKSKLEAHSDTFKVEIRLTQLNKVNKAMEKYKIPTKVTINGSPLRFLEFNLIPQLNPTLHVPLDAIDDGMNILVAEWELKNLPKESELFFSMAVVQKLTDTEMLAEIFQKPSISKSTTVGMIRGVIERSVSDGVMENGSFMEVSLVCPLGKNQMLSPCRAITCTHYSCFDVETFFNMTKVHSTWKCPVCYNQIDYDDIRIDEYFEDIIQSCDKDTQRVQINAKGDWEVTNYKEKDFGKDTFGCSKNKGRKSVIVIGEEDEDDVQPMEISNVTTKKNLARQSIEIIFEKPVKRFKPNNH